MTLDEHNWKSMKTHYFGRLYGGPVCRGPRAPHESKLKTSTDWATVTCLMCLHERRRIAGISKNRHT